MFQLPKIPSRIGVVALTVVSVWGASHGVFQESRFAAAQETASGGHIYVMNDLGTRLLPIDSTTLASVKDAPVMRIAPRGVMSPPLVVTTPDGSVVAAATYRNIATRPKDITIRTFDARTGARRTRPFHPAVPLWIEGISPDGSELYGSPLLGSRQPGTFGGYVIVSAWDGTLVHRLRAHQVCCGLNANGPTIYDAAAHRLYLLETAGRPAPGRKPADPVLVAYDLLSVTQVSRLTLPGVLAGFWETDRQEGGVPVIASWNPGFALSPDGGEIAILDGNNNMLSLINTLTMNIASTVAVSTPKSLWDRLGELTGIAPSAALAKEIEGVSLQMRFSADGHWLAVTGNRGQFDQQGKYSMTNLGLEMIAVDRAEIGASAMQNAPIMWVEPSLDNSAVYALTSGDQGCPCTLDRLDPTTLKITAQRTGLGAFGDVPYIYLLAG